MSIRQVVRRRRKYIVVILVMALGVCGYITVNSVGEDFKLQIYDDLDALGNIRIVKYGYDQDKYDYFRYFREPTAQKVSNLDYVLSVSLMGNIWHNIKYKDQSFRVSILFVDENYWQIARYFAKKGSLLEKSDIKNRSLTCVLGSSLYEKLAKGKDLINDYISINGDLYKIKGVLGGVMPHGLSNALYFPLSTGIDRFYAAKPIMMYIKFNNWNTLLEKEKYVYQMISNLQGGEGLTKNFSIDGIKLVHNIAKWTEFFVNFSIYIVLGLGGFSMWSILMGTVRDRTNEIGLKKAIGASDRVIFFQFLIEAILVGIFASIFGILMSLAIVNFTMFDLTKAASDNNLTLHILLGILYTFSVCTVAGIYPSMVAARMQVVDAISYE